MYEIEDYRTIPGFSPFKINAYGTVLNKWGKPMKGTLYMGKRPRVYVGSHQFIHRLVLMTFVGPCPEGMEACHLDGDVLNNGVENLRWDTHESNMGDKKEHGTMEHNKNGLCKRGHRLEGANLQNHRGKGRICKACARALTWISSQRIRKGLSFNEDEVQAIADTKFSLLLHVKDE